MEDIWAGLILGWGGMIAGIIFMIILGKIIMRGDKD